MKIAIVGSGASAFGVISKLIHLGIKADVSIFDNHQINNDVPLRDNNFYKQKEKNKTIEQIKKNKFSIIPPKSYFGLVPEKFSDVLYDSNLYGGLTTFWGGVLGIFNSDDLRDWPLKFEDLEPFYAFISDLIPMTQPSRDIFDKDLTNFAFKREIKTTQMIEDLKNIINDNKIINNYSLSAGFPMLAISNGHLKHFNCSYPGACSKDCKNHSTFKSFEYFNKLIEKNNNIKYYNKPVTKFSDKDTKLQFLDGDEFCFDKIFLCAGSVNTSKILINSFEINEGLSITDNGLIQFPLFNFNSESEDNGYNNFIAANLIINSINTNTLAKHQWQVNQCFQYIFDYHIPSYLPSIKRKVAKLCQDRVLIMRGYTDHLENNIYNINKQKSGQFELNEVNIPIKTNLYKSSSLLRDLLSKNYFKSIPSLKILSKTSTHYGSTTPYKSGLFNLSTNSEIVKNTYICDSSVFNTMPSTSPTLTIMANAARITNLSFHEM